MIHHVKGDLLKSDCTVIVHQCNCQSNMGKGIAEAIAAMYPEALQADIDFPHEPNQRMGKFSKAYSQKDNRLIVNLYAQLYPGKAKSDWQYKQRYKALRSGMENLMRYLSGIEAKVQEENRDFPIKVGVPYLMGCALAGGDWHIVSKLLEEVSESRKRDIWIYEFNPK